VITSLNHFEAILGYDRAEIRKVISDPAKYRYSYYKPKSKTGYREISPSVDLLKDIQNRLKDRVFSNVIFPYHILGATRKRSGVLNAKLHSGMNYHFKTDISSFFAFITYKHVNRALLQLGLSWQIAELITKMVTYKGHLTEGASTSSFIANLVGLEFDHEILKICEADGIIYSRYVDDLVFSANYCFKNKTLEFLSILAKYGFRNNHAKTTYKTRDINVTGARTGPNGLKPTKELLQKRNSTQSHNVLNGCDGLIDYIDRVNSMSIADYKRKYAELRFPTKIILTPRQCRDIVTTSETDGPAE
jgi:RNA-directed DNA polymerase